MPSAEKREFQITIIPQGEHTQAFQSFEKTAAKTGERSAKNCEPQLSLQRDNDRITNIRIECSCGQIIDLSCVYETVKSEAPPKPDALPKGSKPDKPKK
jgi:hypothetical protein